MKNFILAGLASVAANNELTLKVTQPQKEHFLNPGFEVPTTELSSISINSVAPCQYLTHSAFFSFAGIIDGDIA